MNNDTEIIFQIIKKIGYLLPRIETKNQYLRRLNRSSYYSAVSRLEKRGLVKKERVGGQMIVRITEKGKKFNFGNKLAPAINRKDGLSTMVIFDVPERYSRERQYFRRKLIQNKFTLIQKSALISPYIYPKELLELEETLGIAKFVTHISAKIDRLSGS